MIHSGTNDLTLTTPIDDFISDISVLITQASPMFPKSKIIYSTLLPRADIPLQTLKTLINMKVIDSFSTPPNVHLVTSPAPGVTHENIFSKGTDELHDTKHLKKRHLGSFAANLVAAVRGRANTKTLRSYRIQYTALCPQPRARSTQRVWKSLVFSVTRLKTARLDQLTQLRGHNSLHHYARLLQVSLKATSLTVMLSKIVTLSSRDSLPSHVQNSPFPTIINSSASPQPNQSGMTGVGIPKELEASKL